MTWRVNPAKLARNAPASLLAIMPAITTSGRDTRSSRSPSAAAATRPPSALCPPSSQISQPGGAWSTSAPEAETLHPRRPFGGDDTGLERRGIDPERIQRAQRGNGEARIVELMPPEQPRRRQIHQAAIILIDQPSALDIDMPLLSGGMQRRAHARACCSITAIASAACSAQITGTPRLMMAAFSPAIRVSVSPRNSV